MKKEELIKLGLDEETAKKVESASTEELKGYVLKTQFDEAMSEKKVLEQSLKERDGQLETLKKTSGDVKGMKKQIETLQAENKSKDEAHATEVKTLKTNSAIEKALINAKAKNARAVKALLELDTDTLEFLEDGSIKGLSEQIEKLKSADDSAFLFDSTKKPKIKGASPAQTGVEDSDGKVDVSKMNYEELTAYMNSNPELEI